MHITVDQSHSHLQYERERHLLVLPQPGRQVQTHLRMVAMQHLHLEGAQLRCGQAGHALTQRPARVQDAHARVGQRLGQVHGRGFGA